MRLDYQKRCELARKTLAGDVWQHYKTGKKLTIRERIGYFGVAVEHESGKRTTKQDHYLAGDYDLVV